MMRHEKQHAWLDLLPHDPLPTLLATDDEALLHFVRRDLLDEPVGPVEALWDLPEPRRILQRQQESGSWRFRGASRAKYPAIDHDLFETFKMLSRLIAMYGMRREHEGVERAAEYVFACQREEGDFRGILGNQYMPYYHGVLTELLVTAGYAEDARVERGIRWLLSMRQDDGAWMMPMLTVGRPPDDIWSAPPLPLDRTLPFSHLVTGMAIRALAAHPAWRRSPEARTAGERLKGRILKPDVYGSRKAASYWTKLQFPFFWPNLLTALDTLHALGFAREDEDVQRGLAWFAENQREDALWFTSYEQRKAGREPSPREQQAQRWVALAVCRVFRHYSP